MRAEQPRAGTLEPGAGAARAWHAHAVEALAAELGVDPARGLAPEEAAARLARSGPNRLPEPERRSLVRMLLAQFGDVMVLVLLAAALVAGVVGEPLDTIAIVAIVLLNAVLGFVQEFRAERAVAALRALAAPSAAARRGGAMVTLPAAELVPGDVVLLEAGCIVPADLRLADVQHLRVDESALTGESLPVEKHARPLSAQTMALGDRANMAFKGTVATYGRAEGLVVATGMRTELGQVARLLAETESTRTPLQQRLRRFAAQLAVLVLVLCALIFGIGLLHGEPPLLMLLTALSLAVAAMPEALPAVVTLALSLGARRMSARHALVRRLPAVETLGSVTYVCADKTGTLTQNRMELVELRRPPFDGEPGGEPGVELLRALALNSDAHFLADGELVGDPTETAVLRHVAARADLAGLCSAHPRLAELPFSSERARMSTLHAAAGGRPFLVVKGAPERVLAGCTHELLGGRPVALERAAAQAAARAMAAAGLRVLAYAQRTELPGPPEDLREDWEQELVLLGLVGLLDPPRAQAADAVEECRSAGIRVVMITGDHPATATAVARRLAIATPSGEALSGAELARLEEETLRARADELTVYARVAPEQKIRIVRALQARGEFVAMTGDGVNDAPALRQADIGIAMGRSGTEVAREAADLVLLDDDFATIVAAVREGRRIYDNVRKFIRYVLTGNSAEIWLLFLAPFVGLPLPLLPIHILWINLVTDGLPGLALAGEPAERDVMRRPPRPPGESVFAHGLGAHALVVGLLMGAVTLLVQGWSFHAGNPRWQTMTFTVLALAQLGHVLAVRSERESLLARGRAPNPALAATVVGTVLLQLATLYVPALNRIFMTLPLTAPELAACFGAAALVPLAVEVEKVLVRRGLLYRASPARR
ncbi:MAG TPA: cation-translocating P-type ATPase [Planctomycetota bacterium]